MFANISFPFDFPLRVDLYQRRGEAKGHTEKDLISVFLSLMQTLSEDELSGRKNCEMRDKTL